MAKASAQKQPAFPKTLGACIDRMRELEIEAKGYEGEAKTCWDAYAVLETHLREKFGRQELEGAQGKLARVEVKDDPVPQVEDWDKFYDYIVKTKSWDLLQRRVGLQAWRARLDEKIVVPGTKVFNRVVLKLTALKRRP